MHVKSLPQNLGGGCGKGGGRGIRHPTLCFLRKQSLCFVSRLGQIPPAYQPGPQPTQARTKKDMAFFLILNKYRDWEELFHKGVGRSL